MPYIDNVVQIDTTNHLGICIADIQNAVGSSRTDIGGLIVNGTVNKWAKHKPFRNSTVGFTLNRAQSTPELRSPARMTAALAANYGLSIPRYASTDFKTNYSDTWTYLRPRGLNGGGTGTHEYYRFTDFDGYLSDCYWQLGPVANRGLYTIFGGYLSVSGSTVFAGDNINFGLQCCEDPDTGVPGLLYPYDFYRETEHNFDLSKYYMGIALLDHDNVLWAITGDRMDTHHTANDINAFLSTSIPTNCADGALVAIPVLASVQSPLDDNTGLRKWTNSPQGYYISLDGASLSLTKASSSDRLEISVIVTLLSNGVQMDFSLYNQSSSTVELSNLYAFLMSGDAYANECGSGHNVPSYIDPGAYGFIEQNWPTARQDVPPSFPLSNPPDIYMYDWDSDYPLHLAARAYNAYPDFRTANNDTYTIASHATVTWSKTITGITGDDFGDYADTGVFLALCVNVVPAVSYVQVFSSWG